MKQETLEEAARNNYPDGDVWNVEQAVIRRLAFMNGAKWQAERMYSEEEVLDLLNNLRLDSYNHGMGKIEFLEWFEQFKKK